MTSPIAGRHARLPIVLAPLLWPITLLAQVQLAPASPLQASAPHPLATPLGKPIGVEITELPWVISAPGRYYLTQSLTATDNADGIAVEADHVTIDLLGYELIGAQSFTATGIEVALGRRFLRVTNGTIRNWNGSAIDANGCSGSRFTHLRFAGNGLFQGLSALRPGAGSLVEDCVFLDNGANGVRTSNDTRIHDCSGVDQYDVYLLAGRGSSISDSTAANAELGTSITVTGKGCRVARCRVSAAGASISMQAGGVLVDCHVSSPSATQPGIIAQGSCRVVGNHVDGFYNQAIQVTNGRNVVDGNVVNGALFGMNIGGLGNLIVRNQVLDTLGTAYTITVGNHWAEILATPGLGFSSNNAWANIQP